MENKEVDEFQRREKVLLDLEYQFICDFIRLRKDHHLSQQQLANFSHTIRETIAKIENQVSSPQLNTLIKILEPLGYTIKIAKIEDDNHEES